MIVKCNECVYASDGFCLRNPPVWSGDRGDFPQCRWKQPLRPSTGCGQGEARRLPVVIADCDRWRDQLTESPPTSGRFRVAVGMEDAVCNIVAGKLRIEPTYMESPATQEAMIALMDGLARARFWRPMPRSEA